MLHIPYLSNEETGEKGCKGICNFKCYEWQNNHPLVISNPNMHNEEVTSTMEKKSSTIATKF